MKSEYLYGLMGCRGGGAARLVFKDVKVPRDNILGGLNRGVEVFKTMMIPERLGTAAMTIGAARPALDVATGYTSRRKAFGRAVAEFQGVSFIYPVERIVRDLRLASIWTGSNEVMSMIIASEWYKEYWKNKASGKIRNPEADAAEAEAPDEKIFE